MKITLTNNSSKQSVDVYPRGEPEIFFNQKAFKISYSTFRRIVKTLCPKPTDSVFGINDKNENYRLVKWDYNYRSHNDASEYYIVCLKNNEPEVRGVRLSPSQCTCI